MYYHPKPASHATALRPGQLRHVIRVASITGRRTLAAKVLATTGKVELVQLLLGHAEADHVWPYLDVDQAVIQKAFSIAL
ncbi:hypothetical protein [Aeromonas sp. HMWF014]|uniref:hypothetical protein n=1 Tax=Aeromonas sp. HMWF014 TaxID=2056850 RepID=UPI002159E9D8|nr:hypothetical protein [Aeromonas sp. HMWF014]